MTTRERRNDRTMLPLHHERLPAGPVATLHHQRLSAGPAATKAIARAAAALVLLLCAGLPPATLAQSPGTWTAMAPLPSARQGLALAAVNGKVYAIGGYDLGPLATVEVYDPGTNVWTPVASMTTPRAFLAAAVVGGKIYVIGGLGVTVPGPYGYTGAVEVYDPGTNAWTTAASMPTARYALAAAAVGGLIYAVGGYNDVNAAPPGATTLTGLLDVTEVYDPVKNTWTTLAPTPPMTARMDLGAAGVGGKLYAFGGQDASGAASNVSEVYDPATNAWAPAPVMPSPRQGFAAVAVRGKIYAIGGDAPDPTGSVDVFNPVAGTWAAQTALATARGYLGGAVLGTKVYAVGGYADVYLAAVETFQLPQPPAHDFDGDGKSDILWRNADGSDYLWLMNGTAIQAGSGPVAGTSTDWTVAGVADFDGDGKSDILWRNADGSDYLWLMNGTAIQAGSGPVAGASTDWQVAGVADFDGDGKADILWRNADGSNYIWLMNGTAIQAGSGPVAGASTDWQVAGVADFDGDGKADILWRNVDGSNYIWLMNGTAIQAGSGPVAGASTDWQVAGVADFDGDGKADILWRNVDGSDYIWLMNGTAIQAGSGPVTGAPAAPTDWHVAGVADFDGDGKADILWRNVDGSDYLWLMNATAIKAGSGSVAGASTGWNIAR